MDAWDSPNCDDQEPAERGLVNHDESAYQQYVRDLQEYETKNLITFWQFSGSLAVRSYTVRKAREYTQFYGDSAQAWTFLKESYLVNSASTRLRRSTELHQLRMNAQETLDSYKDRIFVFNSKYQSVNNIGFGDEELISTSIYDLD